MYATFLTLSTIAFAAMVVLGFVGLVRKKPKPDDRPLHTKTRVWLLGAAGVWFLTLVVSFAVPRDVVHRSDSDGGSADSQPSRYTQTWGKDYASTTCTDWTREMSDQQQFAAAADILTAAWQKIEGSSKFPPDALIEEFQGGVTTACVVPSATLTDISYGVYKTEPRFRP